MKTILNYRFLIATFFIGCLYANASSAIGVFSDDFESGLGAWTGKNGGWHSGVIVADPSRPDNKVLTFTSSFSAGDIFTATQFSLNPNYTYIISFEYLGRPILGSIPNNLGGYAGLSEGLPGKHQWYYGTGTAGGATDILIDDGKWHLYTYYVRPNVSFYATGGSGNKVRLMFEDYVVGPVGDVFFDNIHIEKTFVVAPNARVLLPLIQQP